MRVRLLACLLSLLLLSAASAPAKTSHAVWPEINGMLLMNKTDSTRPLEARPGYEAFAGQDPSYSCDEVQKRGKCQQFFVECASVPGAHCPHGGKVISTRRVHNELLGGHGSDTIHAGPLGTVIWGDYKPSGQGTKQVDRIWGGAGRDFIYGSHGKNIVRAGGGNDYVKAHFTQSGSLIDCGPGKDVLYIPKKTRPKVKIRNCETVSAKTLGY